MNERYNQMIDDVYKKYSKEHFKEWVVGVEYESKESFINKIKTDDEFGEKWGKITERELSFEERTNYGVDILGYESLLDYGHSQNDDDIILELLNIWNVPTKKYQIEYNNEIVEYYE